MATVCFFLVNPRIPDLAKSQAQSPLSQVEPLAAANSTLISSATFSQASAISSMDTSSKQSSAASRIPMFAPNNITLTMEDPELHGAQGAGRVARVAQQKLPGDLKKMSEMGIKFTHFAEFAWAMMEPEEISLLAIVKVDG